MQTITNNCSTHTRAHSHTLTHTHTEKRTTKTARKVTKNVVREQREVGEERSRKEPKKKPRTTLHFSAVERAPPSRLARHAASRYVGLHTLLCSRLSSLDFAVWLLSQRVPNGPMRFNKLKLKPEKLMEFFIWAFPLVVAALRASLCGACVPLALSRSLFVSLFSC